MQFSPEVERWRPEVSQYFGPFTDQALWVMQYESGGNPQAVGDNGAAIGLFQIQHTLAGRPSADWLSNPSNNIQYAAQQLGGANGNFGAWGQGTEGLPPYNPSTGFGMFGALGNHPFPAELLTGVAGNGGGSATPSSTVGLSNPFDKPPNPFTDFGGFLKWVNDPTGVGAPGFGGNGGGVLGNVNPAAWVPPIIEGTLQQLGRIPGFEALGSGLVWLTDPHHWMRMGFYLIGGLTIIGGFYFISTGLRTE